MTYSCSDFTSSIVNHLYTNGLISLNVAESEDLEQQATASIAAINKLIMKIDPAPATQANGAAPDAPAARFMAELLEANETLTEIGDQYGPRTLADCMYLLSALQKGTHIEVHHPTESNILDVVQALPSADEWMQHVHEVAQ